LEGVGHIIGANLFIAGQPIEVNEQIRTCDIGLKPCERCAKHGGVRIY
jgi:hypothetical protein